MGELAELSDANVKAARRTRTIPTSPKCHREILSNKKNILGAIALFTGKD